MIASTNRLNLREWNLQDADFLFRLNSDPEVIKYTGDPPFSSVSEAESFIANYTHYKTYGYGRWLCELKSTGEPVGWAGLKNQLKEEGIIDLGFRFLRDHWNQGLATEAGKVCLLLGFKEFDINEITGRAAIKNEFSGRALQKIGMTPKPELKIHHGQTTLHYSISQKEYFNS